MDDEQKLQLINDRIAATCARFAEHIQQLSELFRQLLAIQEVALSRLESLNNEGESWKS